MYKAQDANDPKQTFPSLLLSGYTNIIPPARKTKRGMEMSKNGNKIAVVGGASRVGCAAMTVTAAAILTASTLRAESLEQTSPDAMIQALQGAFGAHPGFRKNHAKGTCATGSFVGLSEATPYSRSALFSGATIPVVARFSLGGGDPDAPDAGKGPRGMGLEFRFADGSKQHMTMINAPMFKPDPAALKAFAETHPESAAMTEFYADHNPPPSYANSAPLGTRISRRQFR
jgi:catalase